MNQQENKPQIMSIDQLLGMNLFIPDYQRPYKWTTKNINELILDIQQSIEESKKYPNAFKYRIGTIILHKEKDETLNGDTQPYNIVDGQQRTLSLLLLKMYLESGFECNLLKNQSFSDKITQKNLHDNYVTIVEWFSAANDEIKENFKNAFSDILEVVVITVGEVTEAFQLFDSQNSRGRALYPHDLLKAYHLREICDKYDLKNAVVKWESKNPKAIRELFDLYLYPLWNWARCRRSGDFTANNIDVYKGVEESTGYTYAHRANKAMPFFLLSEPFISGKDFFEMVEHYMLMLRNIKEELVTNPAFEQVKKIFINPEIDLANSNVDYSNIRTAEALDKSLKNSGAGFKNARNLFLCALLCYYDRFHNFDVMAVKKLFTWSMMVRVDVRNLGFDSINRYAIGVSENSNYSNNIAMISKITYARLHTEISSIKIEIKENQKKAEHWAKLYKNLRILNGYTNNIAPTNP